MSQIRVVHCADIHLDAPFSSLGKWGKKSEARRQDLKDVLSRIINVAKDYNAHLLLICGDLYEHGYVRKSTMAFVKNRFEDIIDTKVVLIPGNHDPYVENSYYASYEWPSNVHVLNDNKSYVKFDDINTVVHYFVPGRGLLSPVDNRNINILMLHGTLDITVGNPYNPVSSDELASLSMDYIAAGHFHNHFISKGSCCVYNPGSPEPLGFDEPGNHGVLKIGIKKERMDHDVVFEKTAICEYVKIDVPLDGCISNEEAFLKAKDAISDMNKHDCLLEINFTGTLGQDSDIDIETIGNMIYENNDIYHLKTKDETGKYIDIDDLLKSGGLKGLFAEKMLKKLENSESEYEKRVLRRALDFGIQALENEEISL